MYKKKKKNNKTKKKKQLMCFLDWPPEIVSYINTLLLVRVLYRPRNRRNQRSEKSEEGAEVMYEECVTAPRWTPSSPHCA